MPHRPSEDTPGGYPRSMLTHVATACPARSIGQAIGPIDDLLVIHRRPDDVRRIWQAVRADLADALDWRRGHMAVADAAAEAHDRELDHALYAAEAVEIARSCRDFYGRRWRLSLPGTARRCGQVIHLDILDAEGDPIRLAAALDRHYPTVSA